jgi:hypothetical protein
LSTPADNKNIWNEPGVSQYTTICLSALGAILLVLVQRGFGIWALLPVLAGLLAGFTRLGPMALALAIALAMSSLPPRGPPVGRRVPVDIPNLIVCGAVLAYAVAHYRLQGLILNIFPLDERQPPPGPEAKSPPTVRRRAVGMVTREEVGALLLALPAWALVAQVLQRFFPEADWHNPGIKEPVWQAIMLIWLIGVPVMVAAAAFGLWRWKQMKADEALLLLQDELWKDTRGEQRRITRWLAWKSLGRERKESP